MPFEAFVWDNGQAIEGQILQLVDRVVCGDATNDGTLTAADALAVLIGVGSRHCSRILCDVDADGPLDATDALLNVARRGQQSDP